MMNARAAARTAASTTASTRVTRSTLNSQPLSQMPSHQAISATPNAANAEPLSTDRMDDEDDASDDDLSPSLVERHKRDFRAQANASFIQRVADPLSLNPPPPNSQGRSFPLSASSQLQPSPDLPIEERYRLDGAFFLDGGCVNKEGSSAFVAYHHRICHVATVKLPSGEGTNNIAEFQALLNALSYAALKKLRRILIVTDSQIVANFIKGLNRITQEHLIAITLQIRALLSSFEAIFVSHIHAHRNLLVENDVADALCSWAINANQTLSCTGSCSRGLAMSSLPTKLRDNTSPFVEAHLTSRHCALCHQNAKHKTANCPIRRFAGLEFATARCHACLSPHHPSEDCPLLAIPARRPVLSSLIPRDIPPATEKAKEQADRLYSTNIDNFHFPNNCSRAQFVDYHYTALLGLDLAETREHVDTARKAIKAFHCNFHFDGLTIKRSKPRRLDARNIGSNRNPSADDAEDNMARRAMRAARLIKARPAHVSKALRKGEKIPLSPDIIAKLTECYPDVAEQDKIIFQPMPLPAFAVSRDAVARVIMARDPSSHPGDTGLSFDALQHYCRWTYKAEEPDKPDHRWDLLCHLISKIMSGNAVILSDMLLDVVGAFFDKNAEKPPVNNQPAPFALRNLGIEESLLRIAATLVFETVLPVAIQKEYLSLFDLGAGKKSGAEIFGRIAAMLSRSGSAIAVFDVVKAFNNLRRQDILNAVRNFNHPLLSAFVHFIFSKDSKVTFTCPITKETFVTTLKKGIHQGNPLSVFIFCLTIAYILRDFRVAHPSALITTFVDDIQFIMHRDAIEHFPEALACFHSLFSSHGLRFDLSDSAKSSVYSVRPLPRNVQLRIESLGMRCQNEGIAPCKIACGTKAFVDAHAEKLKIKLHTRFLAFKALWRALIRYDRGLKRPSNLYSEHFLNLVRLSFLSMPMYVLRTLKPSACVAYRRCSSDWAIELIRNVFPSFIELPPSAIPNTLDYPDLESLWKAIIQIPLSLGGFSLRLPDSVGDIAYAASCMDSLPMMRAAALKIGTQCAPYLIPDLQLTLLRIQKILPALNANYWRQAEDPSSDGRSEPLQHTLTALLNAADIKSIADRLEPWPMYHLAWLARTHKLQKHVSLPINPKTRAFCGLGALSNAEFSRLIAMATFFPVIAPRTCDCGKPLDPAAFHLLHCHLVNFTFMHDRVKEAVAYRLRSFSNSDLAPLVVQIEQPVRLHYPLRDPSAPEGAERVADLVVSLHGDLQQEPLICDITSCLARQQCLTASFNGALHDAARLKVQKYHKYLIAPRRFYALPFGRTNVLSAEILDFCSVVGGSFPLHFRAEQKLLATFSRSIYVGVTHTLSLAIRRLQLSLSARIPFSSVRPLPLLSPFATQSRSRPLLRHPSLSALTDPLFHSRIAAVFAGSSSDFQSHELSEGGGHEHGGDC